MQNLPMKMEAPAIKESPATECEFAANHYRNAVTKKNESCEKAGPVPLTKSARKPPVSFYEAAYYWILTRS
jgi:hypothetical protein